MIVDKVQGRTLCLLKQYRRDIELFNLKVNGMGHYGLWDSTECRMIISNVRGEGGSRQEASCYTHAQLRHEARDEAGRKDFQTPGTGRSSLFLPYSRREDRGSGIVCWLDFPVYQSDTLLQEKHPWILVSVRNIDIY